jgi:hypothetical protein
LLAIETDVLDGSGLASAAAKDRYIFMLEGLLSELLCLPVSMRPVFFDSVGCIGMGYVALVLADFQI